MQRRQLLKRLGVGLVGGAAIIGTGAFRQVDAPRNVTVSTTDDSSANLVITGPTDETTTTTSGVVELSLSKINTNAVATFDNILEFDYNGAEDLSGTSSGDNQLELTILDFSNSAVDFYRHGTTTSVVGSSNTWKIQDPSNLPVAVDMEIDTTVSADPMNLSEIEIKAEVTEIS